MRWSVEPVDVAETRHLVLQPLDDEAAEIDAWPVAPAVLCGVVYNTGRQCLDCAARWSGVLAATEVVQRRRARAAGVR